MEGSKKFWRAVIGPDQSVEVSTPENKILMISNACLASFPEEHRNEPTRIIVEKLHTATPCDPMIIGTLIPDRREHLVLQFKNTEENQCKLSVRGFGTVHLAGYYINLEEEVDEEDNEAEDADVPEVSLPKPSEIS